MINFQYKISKRHNSYFASNLYRNTNAYMNHGGFLEYQRYFHISQYIISIFEKDLLAQQNKYVNDNNE